MVVGSEGDLEKLASTHACVRALRDDNAKLAAAVRGFRLLLRDPSARLVQRVWRGVIARRRFAKAKAAVVTCQSVARRSIQTADRRRALRCVRSLQARRDAIDAELAAATSRLTTAEVAVAAVAAFKDGDDAAWRASLKVGDAVDAKDKDGRWFDAVIVDVAADGSKLDMTSDEKSA